MNATATTSDTSNLDMPLRLLDTQSGWGDDMRTVTMLVTPSIAKAWLTRNVVNRPICKRNLAKLTWALRNAAFQCTPQGIAFNRFGKLVDGQHRLTAIVETGISASLRVTFDFHGDVHAMLDVGRSRTTGDIVHRSLRSVALCSALAMLTDGTEAVAAEQNERIYAENKTAVDWSLKALPTQRRMTAQLGAALAFAYPTASAKVAEFADHLVSFRASVPDAPVIALRKFVERERDGSPAGRLRLMHATLRAVQATVEGKPLTRIPSDSLGYTYFAHRRARLGV